MTLNNTDRDAEDTAENHLCAPLAREKQLCSGSQNVVAETIGCDLPSAAEDDRTKSEDETREKTDLAQTSDVIVPVDGVVRMQEPRKSGDISGEHQAKGVKSGVSVGVDNDSKDGKERLIKGTNIGTDEGVVEGEVIETETAQEETEEKQTQRLQDSGCEQTETSAMKMDETMNGTKTHYTVAGKGASLEEVEITMNGTVEETAREKEEALEENEKEKGGGGASDADIPDDGVPYDKGWAWMVVLGAFINFFIAAGYNSANFVFFVKFLDEFEAPVSKTALLYGVKQAVNSIVGLFVMNALVGRIGVRKTVLMGGFFISLSAILGSFATDLTSLILTQAVFHGLGLSMTGMSPTLLIGYFFRRRRSLANSISKCGVGVGSMVFPPMTTYFLQEYGLRGSLLLMGGICLNNLTAAALMRPTSFYKKRKRLRSENCGDDAFHDISKICPTITTERTTIIDETDASSITTYSKPDDSPSARNLLPYFRGTKNSTCVDYVNRKEPKYLPVSFSDHTAKVTSLVPCENDVTLLTRSSPDISPHNRPAGLPPRRRNNTVSEGEHTQLASVGDSKERKLNRSLLDIISDSTITLYLSRPTLLNDDIITFPPDQDECSPAEPAQPGKKITCCGRVVRSVKWVCGVLDFSLFHSPMFRVLTVFFLTSPIVYSLATYLPVMCKDRGISDYKAAILLSIIGGLDLCSRLIFGFIADLKIMKVSTLIAISFFLLGGLCHVTSLLTTFPLLIGFAVVFGVLSGVSPCLLPILIMEDIGLEFTPQALGFCKLFSAASMAAGLPLLGYMRDITGSYDVTNHVTGVFTLVSGVLLIALRYFPHRHPRHRERILVREECSPLTKKSPSK